LKSAPLLKLLNAPSCAKVESSPAVFSPSVTAPLVPPPVNGLVAVIPVMVPKLEQVGASPRTREVTALPGEQVPVLA